MSSDDHLAIRVEGLKALEPKRSLYLASAGPNVDGDISKTISIRVPAEEFEQVGLKAYTSNQDDKCSYDTPELSDPKQGAGCVVFELKPAPARPTLSLTRTTTGVTLRVRADNIQTRLVSARVVGVVFVGRRRLASILTPPDASGNVDISVEIPLQARVKRVCAEGRLVDRVPKDKLECPVTRGDEPASAYVELARPLRTKARR